MEQLGLDGCLAAPLALGGRYQLGEELGRGGMGVVRAGRDLRLQRDVAVKVLHPDMAVKPGTRERFEVEARAAASLAHPQVVAVFDSGEEAGIPFLVMERLAGRTLADAIDDGPMGPGAVRQLGLQVLDALAAAHAAGLLHRDIKPANVLAAGPGNWKVGDFGIAKSLVADDADLTATGMIVGTPTYLPPERLAGGAATPSGDLYAVGVVLYEALLGRRGRPQASPAPVYSPLPPLEQVRPGLPPDLVAVVTRAIGPDPAARFASASEMAARLRGRPVPGPIAPTEAMLSHPAATEVFPGPAPQGRWPPFGLDVQARRGRPQRFVLAALAAGLFLMVVALAISLSGHHAASSPTPTPSVATVVTPAAGPTATTRPAGATAQPISGSPGGKGHGKHGK